jgi:FAD:protein FMN transferase
MTGNNHLARCRPLLGTYVEITLQGDFTHAQLIELSQRGFAAIEQVQQLMSFHASESELTRINRYAHLEPRPISALTFELLQQALQLSELSQGLFDVTVGSALVQHRALPNHDFCPPDNHLTMNEYANWQAIQLQPETIFFSQPLQIDLGGIAKGFAVDKAFDAIQHAADKLTSEANNLNSSKADINICINAGGDLRMSHWQQQTVGIRHPQHPQQLLPITLKNTALATSAGYFLADSHLTENAGIYSPKTHTPVRDNRSYSVFANTCMLADALTKVIALMENPAPLLTALNAEALII